MWVPGAPSAGQVPAGGKPSSVLHAAGAGQLVLCWVSWCDVKSAVLTALSEGDGAAARGTLTMLCALATGHVQSPIFPKQSHCHQVVPPLSLPPPSPPPPSLLHLF